MNKPAFLTKLLLCLFSFSVFAQNEIHLSTLSSENIESAVEIQKKSEDQFYLIQFSSIPNEFEKSQLAKNGVDLLTYIPDKAYYAKITSGYSISEEDVQIMGITKMIKITPQLKIDNALKDTSNLPSWIENGNTIEVIVHFYPILKNSGLKLLSTMADIQSYDTRINAATIKITKQDLNNIAKLNSVRFIEPTIQPFDIEEVDAMTNQRSNFLKDGNIHFDGTGVAVHIGDGGTVSDHLDYEGRLTITSSIDESSHATHVCGIVGGAGNFDPMVQGQAPGATLYSHDGSAILYSSTVLNNALSNNVVITTHSLGWGCNGGYNGSASSADQDMVDNPSLIHVFSAGNSGNDDCNQYPSGWGNITGGYKQGKNVFAVANLTNTDGLASSSSRGPASDGRIKPDIGAVGSGVYHTQAGNTYGSKSGTSMAAPAVTGVLAQLYQAYKSLNGGANPNAALIRALTLNTAEDLGNEGPDFKYGWGRINARKAYELMANNQYFNGTITNGATANHNISVPNGTERIKIMVYWTDPAGPSGATKALINDIDMTVNNGGTTELPYVLSVSESNTSILDAPATKGADHLNNMEQVVIDNPASNLTVNLSGYAIATGSQEYYITYEFIKDEITVTFPNGGDKLSTDESYTIRWDAFGDNGTFDIEFSADNGNTWSTIASGVSGSNRYYTGWSPSSTTEQGLIRISRNGVTDVSDGVFTTIGVPQNATFEWACNNQALITWDPVGNATGYTVYQMGTKYMEPIGTTTGTSFIANIATASTDYFAVAANINDSVGMRTIAFLKNAGAFGTCPNGPDLVIQNIDAPISEGCLEGGSSQEVIITVGNEGSTSISSFDVNYTFNSGATVNQTINTPLSPGQSIAVTFNSNITLPNSGQPQLKIWGVATGDVDLTNDTSSIIINMDQASFGLPLAENFDSESSCGTASDCEATTCNLNSWLQNTSDDDIDWRVDGNGTPSADTGPGDDRTGGGNYIYLEGSTCYGKTAILKSGCIELNTNANLSFYYSMYGENMGNLAVEIFQPSTNSTILAYNISGDQGTGWNKVDVDLSAYAGSTVQILFKGTTGSSWKTDIALDDILIESVDLTDLVITSSSSTLTICDTVTFNGDGPSANTTYDWNFGTNAIPATATGKGPHKVYYSSTGSKTITLNGDGGLSETTAITVSDPINEASASINGNNLPSCTGAQFDFQATGSNLGNTPTYEWTHNGNAVGSNSSSYSIYSPSNGDIIQVKITSDAECLLEDTAFATYTIQQNEGFAHTFYISATSMNPSGNWELRNSSNQLVESNGTYTTNGTYEEQEFCLVDDCYDFTFTNAFQAGNCNDPAWQAQAYPTAGTRVSHNGNIFESKWYANAGDEPDPTLSGGATPWEYIGPCQQSIDSDNFGIKTSDDAVTHFEETVLNYSSPFTTNFCLGTITAVKSGLNQQITIYPNPTNGNVSIGLDNSEGSYYEIFDTKGQLIVKGKIPSPTFNLNLEQYKPGLYFIKINASDNVYTKAIIKK